MAEEGELRRQQEAMKAAEEQLDGQASQQPPMPQGVASTDPQSNGHAHANAPSDPPDTADSATEAAVAEAAAAVAQATPALAASPAASQVATPAATPAVTLAVEPASAAPASAAKAATAVPARVTAACATSTAERPSGVPGRCHAVSVGSQAFDTELDRASFDVLQTGDVLLYATSSLGARFNQAVQLSKWNHTSLVVRAATQAQFEQLQTLVPEDYAYSPASAVSRERLFVFEVVPRRGVTLFPLEARLARMVKRIKFLAVRPLNHEQSTSFTEAQFSALFDFMKSVQGRELETASRQMFRTLLLRGPCGSCCRNVCCFSLGNNADDWDEFFCSELVIAALQQLGVVQGPPRESQPAIGLISNEVLPTHFTSDSVGPSSLDSSLCPGYSYGKELLLMWPGSQSKSQLLEWKSLLRRWDRMRRLNTVAYATNFLGRVRARQKSRPSNKARRHRWLAETSEKLGQMADGVRNLFSRRTSRASRTPQTPQLHNPADCRNDGADAIPSRQNA